MLMVNMMSVLVENSYVANWSKSDGEGTIELSAKCANNDPWNYMDRQPPNVHEIYDLYYDAPIDFSTYSPVAARQETRINVENKSKLNVKEYPVFYVLNEIKSSHASIDDPSESSSFAEGSRGDDQARSDNGDSNNDIVEDQNDEHSLDNRNDTLIGIENVPIENRDAWLDGNNNEGINANFDETDDECLCPANQAGRRLIIYLVVTICFFIFVAVICYHQSYRQVRNPLSFNEGRLDGEKNKGGINVHYKTDYTHFKIG